jgi:hypothetical protein
MPPKKEVAYSRSQGGYKRGSYNNAKKVYMYKGNGESTTATTIG